jgi:cell division protein FtsQ
MDDRGRELQQVNGQRRTADRVHHAPRMPDGGHRLAQARDVQSPDLYSPDAQTQHTDPARTRRNGSDTGRTSTHRRSRRLKPAATVLRLWIGRAARLAILAAIVTGGALAIGPTRSIVEKTVGTAEDFAIAAGLGLDTVSLSGQRFTTDTDIFDCLNLAQTRTLLALNTITARTCIEALPWVANASLTRVYPGRLDVAVAERRPFAIWQRDTKAAPTPEKTGTALLVDRTGRVLAPATGHREALLRIAGDGAPEAAAALTEALVHVPAISARLDGATRIDGRRWSLALSGNVTIELPAEGEATALADLFHHADGPGLLTRGDTVIDLRSRFEIAARPALARTPSVPTAGGG